MSDEREFDRMVEEELSALPPPDEAVRKINPWRRAMGQIVWGYALTTMTLTFWRLDVLLPALGTLLLFLGFRSLRRENGWFAACWGLSLWELAAFALQWAWDAAARPPLPPAFTTARTLLMLVQLFCLWRGILAVRRAAGQGGRTWAAGALLVFRGALSALYLLGGSEVRFSGLTALAVLALFLCILASLFRLPALLDGAGYEVTAAPARLSVRAALALWVLVLGAGAALTVLLWGRYPLEWSPLPRGGGEAEEIRAQLEELGMPQWLLEDLPPEELARYEGALSAASRTDPTSSAIWEAGYREPEVTMAAVQLPGGSYRLICAFRWPEDVQVRGSDCLELWPPADHYQIRSLSGQLLCERGGETVRADHFSLEAGSAAREDPFFGPESLDGIYARLSFPLDGKQCRGWVAMDLIPASESVWIDSWLNYGHQKSWLNYPWQSALDFYLSGGLRDETFDRAQYSTLFHLEEDGTPCVW